MKLLFCLIGLVLVFGAGAQETYVGVSGDAAFLFDLPSVSVTTDSVVISPGVQLGVRNLLGPFGLRIVGEYSVSPTSGLLEVGGDVLFNFGSVIDPYLGAGAGLAVLQGGRIGLGRALVGIGPRLSPSLGLFGEGMLNAYSNGNGAVYTIKARAGLNFFF